MSRFGAYVLVRRLGVGGMAEVFLADAPAAAGQRRRVVVKRLLPHLEDRPQFVRMFLDEAQLTSRLSHPNIVRIDGFGEAEGVHYLALEFVDGLSLAALLRALGAARLELALGCHVVAEACAALAYAHEERDDAGQPLRIVHRDVSPDNILLSRAGEVKLADFGIAKATTQIARTLPGQLKGKRLYMSPEQAMRRADVDGRADIFSAGVVLYELTVGQRLFSAPSDAAVLQQIVDGAYPPPLPEGYPAPLAEIVRRALHKDPAARFQRAAAMRAALLRLTGDPATATTALAALVQRLGPSAELGPSARDARITDVGTGTAPGIAPTAVTLAERGPGLFPVDTVPGYADTERVPALSGPGDEDALEAVVTAKLPSPAPPPLAPTPAPEDDDDGPRPVRAADPPTYEVRWSRLGWDPRAAWREGGTRPLLVAAALIAAVAGALLVVALRC